MKLKLTQQVDGSLVENFIVEVGAISISTDRTTINFNVGYYITDGGTLIKEDYFSFGGYQLEGDNPEKQAYDYLISLPYFSNASVI